MTATTIDGKALAAKVRAEVATEVAQLDHVGLATVLVGDDPAQDLEALAAQQLLERIAAPVLARAGADAVRNGEHGGLQTRRSFVFSTSVTSAIVIALSIAFAMS